VSIDKKVFSKKQAGVRKKKKKQMITFWGFVYCGDAGLKVRREHLVL